MSKLQFYGIAGRDNPLIKSYIKDGYQRVKAENWYIHPSTFSGWGKVRNGVPQGLILALLLFLLYITDLHNITVTSPSPKDYKSNITKILENINYWFEVNLLTLNFDKPYYIQFMTKNISASNVNFGYDTKQIVKPTTNTKFL